MGAKQTRDQDGLTDLERRFATYYLEEFNGTKAYTQASARKVTKKTAEVSSYKMLRRPAVQAFVKAQRDKLLDKAELSVGDTLTKLRQLMLFDVRDMVDDEGNVRSLKDMPDDLAAACIGFKDTQWGREYKFVDKGATLDKALRYHGLFDKDNAQKIDPVADLIKHIYGAGGRLQVKE